MANNNNQFIENLTHKSFYPWVVWGLAASFFFFEYLARVAPGVMVDELMHDLHVTAFALGSLSAFFYYAYISMQIPVGMLADRFSPRWLLTSMTLLTALSCIIFASAHNMGSAAFGRLVMGFGSAFAFVTALKVAAIWFPSQRLGLLAGLTQALGMFGAGISQVVVAHGVGTIGWRPTMILISCLFILLSFTISLFVREKAAVAKKIEDTVASGKEVWFGLLAVLKNPQTWWNGLFVGLLYAPTEALAELWGVKFLRQTHGLSNEVAAFAIGLIFIGWTVGAPLSGWISDYIRRRKPVIIVSALLSLIFISLVLYLPHLTPLVLFPLLFLYGVSNTGVATSYAIAAEINPRPVSGTSMAFANMASVLVGGAFQPLIGWLLDKHWDGKIVNGIPIYSIADFRVALMALPICLLIAVFVAMRVKETHGELMDAKVTI